MIFLPQNKPEIKPTPETSMEEDSTDHHRPRQEEDDEEYGSKGSSTKRSYYGCSFCKQGFTNAQALGGHMNIHRKHRVIKKKTKPEGAMMMTAAAKSSVEKEFNNDEFLRYYGSIFQHVNPKKWSHQSLNKHEFDLTLQIGSAHEDVNGDRPVNVEEDDDNEVVDLELRLGHNPS